MTKFTKFTINGILTWIGEFLAVINLDITIALYQTEHIDELTITIVCKIDTIQYIHTLTIESKWKFK